VPDFEPSLAGNPHDVIADADNNLWILPRASASQSDGSVVYDVVSRESRIIDRVRIPTGSTLIGFGENGIVYLVTHDGGRTTLVKASRR
jgi:hypothetical protein